MELRLSPRYLEAVVTARKHSTIRDGVLVFSPNCEVLLRFSRTAPPLVVRVTDYRVKRFGDLSQKEVDADGFAGRNELFVELRQYYPHISEESIVTVIEFAVVSKPAPDNSGRARKKTGQI
jgi:hypothetical protein